jgi:hypothetical protein
MKFDNSILKTEIKSALEIMNSLNNTIVDGDTEGNIDKTEYVLTKLIRIKELVDALDERLQQEK